MKGFLSFHDKPFPFTHNLHEIAKLCTEVSDETDWDREEITALTNYAVQLRYDNDFWPTKAEAMDALGIAERSE